MGPDNFIRRPSQPRQPQQPRMQPYNPNPQPLHPQQAPQYRTPRPMDEFAPRPQQPRMAPVPAKPVPRNPHAMQPQQTQQLRQTVQDPYAPRPQQQPVPKNDAAPVDFSAHLKDQKKPRFSKKMKLALACAVVFAGASLAAFATLNKETDKTHVSAAPKHAPLVKPGFVVYFPNPLPDGLTTSKGTVMYTKQSFSFILQKDGQNRIYVVEQPGSTDPDLKIIKSKLTAPQKLDFNIGKGVDGGLGTRTVTAVKTEENAIITITCSKIDCKTYSRLVIANMKMVDNIESLRNNNL